MEGGGAGLTEGLKTNAIEPWRKRFRLSDFPRRFFGRKTNFQVLTNLFGEMALGEMAGIKRRGRKRRMGEEDEEGEEEEAGKRRMGEEL